MSDDTSNGRRDFLKTMGAAAGAAAGAASGIIGEAHADSFKETATRYVPPGQWPNHLLMEWWEFPSDDPAVVEVWGYTDKLSYLPGEKVGFHVTTGAPTFDIRIYRDGGELELVHEVKGGHNGQGLYVSPMRDMVVAFRPDRRHQGHYNGVGRQGRFPKQQAIECQYRQATQSHAGGISHLHASSLNGEISKSGAANMNKLRGVRIQGNDECFPIR
jgi:hypothetical protein